MFFNDLTSKQLHVYAVLAQGNACLQLVLKREISMMIIDMCLNNRIPLQNSSKAMELFNANEKDVEERPYETWYYKVVRYITGDISVLEPT